MRRTIGTLVAAFVIGSALPAGAQPAVQPPGVGAGVEQGAMAAWIEMHGSTGTFVAADGLSFVDDQGLHTLGGVAKGKCERIRTKGWIITTCFAKGQMKEVGVQGFQMDPALQSASLEVKTGGRKHTVDWTGEEPMFGQGAGASTFGAGVVVFGDASATAKGTVYGKKMGKKCWMCFLYEGAGAMVYTGMQKRAEVSTENGVLKVNLRTWKRR